MNTFKEFMDFLKLPPTILGALAIASGLLLYLPDDVIKRLYMESFRSNYGFIIGIIFVISISILVMLLITYIFKHSKKIIIRKYTGMKDRKGRIKYLLDMDKAKTNLIKSFLKESNHTLDLSMNDGITVELEYMEIISKAGGTQFVNFYGDMAVLKYFLQPWVLKIINEDEQLKKKFLS